MINCKQINVLRARVFIAIYVDTDYTEKLYLHMKILKRESLCIYFVVHTICGHLFILEFLCIKFVISILLKFGLVEFLKLFLLLFTHALRHMHMYIYFSDGSQTNQHISGDWRKVPLFSTKHIMVTLFLWNYRTILLYCWQFSLISSADCFLVESIEVLMPFSMLPP